MIALLMGLKTIAPGDLHKSMQKGVTIVDVNSRASWLQARVPGSLSLDPITYSERDLPSMKDSMLVFYCSNPWCRKAPNAARRAKQMGYSDVRVMAAGIAGWLEAGLPTECGERS